MMLWWKDITLNAVVIILKNKMMTPVFRVIPFWLFEKNIFFNNNFINN